MAIYLKDAQSNIEGGLGTFTYTVIQAGIFNFIVQSTVVPPSGLSIVINKNGSPIATSVAPTSTQEVVNITGSGVNCDVNDSITFVVTSSLPIDSLGNNVKTLINIVFET